MCLHFLLESCLNLYLLVKVNNLTDIVDIGLYKSLGGNLGIDIRIYRVSMLGSVAMTTLVKCVIPISLI